MTDLFGLDDASAVLSPCRTYRYRLDRTWGFEPKVAFIMLNPSTADEAVDDPTIRRCVGFAKSWGYGGLVVGNLFALRSTDPKELYRHPSPVGPDNDVHLQEIARDCHKVVVAWGAHGVYQERGAQVADLLNGYNLAALKLTAGGHPGHPLYIAANAEPTAFFAHRLAR